MRVKNSVLCLVFFSMLAPSVSFARLGENQKELTVRYGEKFRPNTCNDEIAPTVMEWDSIDDPIEKHAYLDANGICQKIIFEFNDREADQIVPVLLEKNSQGQQWGPFLPEKNKSVLKMGEWERADGGKAIREDSHTLTLWSADYFKAQKKLKVDEERKSAENKKNQMNKL